MEPVDKAARQRNQFAVLLSLLSLVLLLIAYFLPLITIEKFGSKTDYTLTGSILVLFREGQVFLGILILIFSVCFPVSKLLLILAASNRLVKLRLGARRLLNTVLESVGRFSLVEVVIVALFVVIMKNEQFVDIDVRFGTILFSLSVLLSIVSSLMLTFNHMRDTDHEMEENDMSENDFSMDEKEEVGKFRVVAVAIALLLVVTGVGLAFFCVTGQGRHREDHQEKQPDHALAGNPGPLPAHPIQKGKQIQNSHLP